MTNNEVISILSNSIRDPSNKNYGEDTLASALTVAKFKLISLVGKDNMPPLVSFSSVTIQEVFGGKFGYFTVPSNFDTEIYIDYSDSGGRPTPFKIIDISEMGNYQYKYSGGDDSTNLIAARESQGNVYLTLGVTSGTAILYYRRETASVAANSDSVDIPQDYIINLVEIARAVILGWEQKYEASEVIMKRQTEELKIQKQEKDIGAD
jgi:hypothetical protein